MTHDDDIPRRDDGSIDPQAVEVSTKKATMGQMLLASKMVGMADGVTPEIAAAVIDMIVERTMLPRPTVLAMDGGDAFILVGRCATAATAAMLGKGTQAESERIMNAPTAQEPTVRAPGGSRAERRRQAKA